MNVEELIARLNYLVDDSVPLTTALYLFNEALDDLSLVAGYTKMAEAAFAAQASTIALPPDLIELVSIRVKFDGETKFQRILSNDAVRPTDYYEDDSIVDGEYGYDWFGNAIEIRPLPANNGSMQIRYYAALPHLAAEEDEPPLNLRYHRLIPLFAAARYMQNWGDKASEKQDFQGDYMQGKNDLQSETIRHKRRNGPKVVVKIRSWS